MGEAKRRGTFEERKESAIEEDLALIKEYEELGRQCGEYAISLSGDNLFLTQCAEALDDTAALRSITLQEAKKIIDGIYKNYANNEQVAPQQEGGQPVIKQKSTNIMRPNRFNRAEALKETKTAWLVIESSPTGEDDSEWTPIHAEDLPDWVKHPTVMGQMRDGEKVSMDPEKGTVWYRGLRCQPQTIN